MTAVPLEYGFETAERRYNHGYLVRPALAILAKQPHRRLFDLGCGNGAIAADLQSAGFDVTGVDASESGIANANLAHPEIKLHVGSAYDDLAARYDRFPIVVSFEVVCYLYDPRPFARAVFDLLEPGGLALISTPYHGYLKNLVIALLGGFDAHWNPLWESGHIKFWSERTITQLLTEAGFTDLKIHRVGRIAPMAKSIIVTARRPRP